MRINRNIMIPILTSVCGGCLGGGLATVYWLKSKSEVAEWRHCASTFERTRLLRQLRAQKNEEAIIEQEILLNGDIFSLGFCIEHFKRNDPSSIEALRRAARYRNQFPYGEPNLEASQAVHHALSLVTPK